MGENNDKTVHICTILGRSVVFVHNQCQVRCKEKECPVVEWINKDME